MLQPCARVPFFYYVVASIFRGRSESVGPSVLRIEGLCNDYLVDPLRPRVIKRGKDTIIQISFDRQLMRVYVFTHLLKHLDLSFYLSNPTAVKWAHIGALAPEAELRR